MAKLSLWFSKSQAGLYELERTLFVSNDHIDKEIVAVRGKTAGAYKHAGTFQWTPGVKALSVICMTAVARQLKRVKSILPLLEGGKDSLASSLDYALNKQPEWLFDMFGTDKNGNTYLRQLLLRSNPGRRWRGTVSISLNEQLLAPQSINIYVENALVKSAEELRRLALAIENQAARTSATNTNIDKNESGTLSIGEVIGSIITPVNENDIQDIFNYEEEQFPGSHATKERLLEWFQHDPNNFMCIKEKDASFMAYYIIFFLKPAALDAFLTGNLLEDDIQHTDLATPSSEVYLEQSELHICVFASRMHASMFTVDLLWHLIGRILDLAINGCLSTIYAEAATKEGQAFLARFGFSPCYRAVGDPLFQLKFDLKILHEWERKYRLRSFCRDSSNAFQLSEVNKLRNLNPEHEKMQVAIIIRRMKKEDIPAAAHVYTSAFPQQTFSKEWLECAFNSFPKCQLFVAEQSTKIVGLILWTEKSGFRKEAFFELEQIIVHPEFQRKGIGSQLIIESLPEVGSKIAERHACLKNIIINTQSDNNSQELYRKTLGAKPVAIVSKKFMADGVYMIAKDVKIPLKVTS